MREALALDGAVLNVEATVLDVIADMTGLELGDLQEPSQFLDARVDSLTAIAIVTRIEAAFEIAVEESAFELLVTRRFAELARLVARSVVDQRAKLDEIERNGSCECTRRGVQCD